MGTYKPPQKYEKKSLKGLLMPEQLTFAGQVYKALCSELNIPTDALVTRNSLAKATLRALAITSDKNAIMLMVSNKMKVQHGVQKLQMLRGTYSRTGDSYLSATTK